MSEVPLYPLPGAFRFSKHQWPGFLHTEDASPRNVFRISLVVVIEAPPLIDCIFIMKFTLSPNTLRHHSAPHTDAHTLQGYLAHKKPPPLGSYSRTMPKALWWS